MPYEWNGSPQWLKSAEQQTENLIGLLDQAYQEVLNGKQVENIEGLLEGVFKVTEQLYPLKVLASHNVEAETLREDHKMFLRNMDALRAAGSGATPLKLHTLSSLINWLTYVKIRVNSAATTSP